MTLKQQELMTSIYEAQKEKDILEDKVKEITSQIKELEETIDKQKELLLEDMSDCSIDELEDTDNKLFANVFAKTNVGYTSDSDVLNALKGNGFTQYIKTKVTESLDKNALKKALKENETLKTLVNEFIKESVTRYVVVTTADNHTKMFEHIDKNAK